MTTRWKIILSTIIIFFFFGVVNLALEDGGGIVKIALVAVGLSLIWSNQHNRLLKAIVSVAVAVALWSFLSHWGPTKDSTRWLSTRGAMHSPRNNFDPTAAEKGKPVAEAGAVICDGKVTRKAPLSYRFDPDTGCPVVPMTPFYAQELLKLESTSTTTSSTCTYCFGSGCEVSMPAVIGPGRFEVRNREHGTTATYTWNLSGEGRWSNPFPSEHGPGGHGGLRWKSQDYQNGEFKGEEWNDKTPDHKTVLVLLCQGSVPHPNS